jgi:hypothetical protein
MRIEIYEKVGLYLCEQAQAGYEMAYKQERIGFLFGTVSNRSTRITKAVAYKGGVKKRTGIDLIADNFDRRGRTLARQFGKRWLGAYHTHVEVDDDIPVGISEHDIDAFKDNESLVELIVSIWATDNASRLKQGKKRLLAIKRFADTNYRISISGYVMTKRGIRLARVIRI